MLFRYYLSNGVGYAEVELKQGDFSKIYTVEYCLGNDLRELLGGLIVMAGYKKAEKLYIDICDQLLGDDDIFEWIASVGSSSAKFLFKMKNKEKTIVNLKILECIEDSEECVFDDDIDFIKFIDDVLVSCSNMLNKYGLIGYFLNYWGEFPVLYYLLLKDFRENKIIFEKVNETINENNEIMEKTNIKNEIEYLKGNK